ncbi:MAG: hypothetical protein QOG19_860 [Mycobacterium sp.]|nr:hypothetical protein [Mycobacterium sp.]
MTGYVRQSARALPLNPALTRAHAAADTALQTALTGLAGTVAASLTLDELLTKVAEFAAQAIPGAVAAGVTLAHRPEARIRVWAATTDFVRAVDTIQYEVYDEGPSITAMRTGRPCISGAIGNDARWPRFGPAVARMSVQSALSLPLMLGDQVIGAINTYASGTDAYGEPAVVMGAEFAGPAAVSIHNARTLLEAQHGADLLQRKLAYRSLINQAIGIIRDRSGASAQQALGHLVSISNSMNTKLNVAAERLVEESVGCARA